MPDKEMKILLTLQDEHADFVELQATENKISYQDVIRILITKQIKQDQADVLNGGE